MEQESRCARLIADANGHFIRKSFTSDLIIEALEMSARKKSHGKQKSEAAASNAVLAILDVSNS